MTGDKLVISYIIIAFLAFAGLGYAGFTANEWLLHNARAVLMISWLTIFPAAMLAILALIAFCFYLTGLKDAPTDD